MRAWHGPPRLVPVSHQFSVELEADDCGLLTLTYHPLRRQFIVGLQQAGDVAPLAQDDFYLDDEADLANPTLEMLTAEVRTGLSARGRGDLAGHAGDLAARFAAKYPELIDT